MYNIELLFILTAIENFFSSDVVIYSVALFFAIIIVAKISYSVGFGLSKNKAVGKFTCLMGVCFFASSAYLVVLLESQTFGGVKIIQTLSQF